MKSNKKLKISIGLNIALVVINIIGLIVIINM